MDMEKVLEDLFKERKVFHSEADFQLALFRKIINIYGNPENIYLEYKLGRKEYSGLKYSAHIDILATDENKAPLCAIELKYVTNAAEIRAKGVEQEEVFRLKSSGHTYAPFSFWEDVHRLELFQAKNPSVVGYAIFLTNRSDYRDNSKQKSCFRIDKELTMPAKKEVRWKDKTTFSLLNEYTRKR